MRMILHKSTTQNIKYSDFYVVLERLREYATNDFPNTFFFLVIYVHKINKIVTCDSCENVSV